MKTSPRLRDATKLAVITALSLAMLATTAIIAVLTVGLATGQLRAMPVLSNSMQPTFSQGDIILVEKMSATNIKNGDIVLFNAPQTTGAPTAHRVVSVSRDSVTTIQTKGDANSSVDPYTSKVNSRTIWHVTHTVPNAGAVITVLRTPKVQWFATVVIVPTFLFVTMRHVWFAGRERRVRSRASKARWRAFGAAALAMSLVLSGTAAAAWSSLASKSATYTSTSIASSYPSNLSCAWTTATTATLSWTASADTSLDGYDPVYATTSGGSTTSLGTVAGRTSTGAPAFTPASPVATYLSVKGTRNSWQSSQSSELPIVTCPRYLNAYAGTGTSGSSGDTGNPTTAKLSAPQGTAIDSSGNLYIADTSNNRVRMVDTAGHITTIAGTGTSGFADGSAVSTAQFAAPTGVAVDGSGNVYIADSGNNRIRKLASGSVSTIAGTGTSGFADGAATATAQFATPTGVAVDGSGNVYIADSGNNRIRKLVSATVSTIIGTGAAGFADGAATSTAQLSAPYGVAVDGSGNVYVADTSNNRIRKLVSTTVSTIAGGGSSGSTGDGGAATSALLSAPKAVAVDSAGNVYVADTSNHRVRVIAGPNIYLLAGSSSGNTGDEGYGSSATLNTPQGIAVNNTTGDVFIGDTTNNRVRALQRTSVAAAKNIFDEATPNLNANDGQAIELGTRFTVDVRGYVTGMRFWKSAANTGTHTGSLWDVGGQKLAGVTFSGESASGWQTAYFSTPVHLNQGSQYIISYFSPTFEFSLTSGYFPIAPSPFHVAVNSGRYIYSGTSAFPSNSTNSSYWVDPIFVPDPYVPTTTKTLFGYNEPPADSHDSALTLGIRFHSTVSGTITGIRFYRVAGATNSHEVALWNASSHAMLASKTTSNETDYGWINVPLDTPIAISANTDYVASFYASDGYFGIGSHELNVDIDSPPLFAPAGDNSGGAGTNYATNGVFNYGGAHAFPYQSWNNTNYYVDVSFEP